MANSTVWFIVQECIDSMLSHQHKTIFVHIPKCGGQSIETMFLDDLGLNWKSRAPLLLRANNDPKLGPPRLAHLLANEYVHFNYVTEDQFSEYFKFSYVRSPYSRAISLYNYLDVKMSLDKFIHEWLPEQFGMADTYKEYPHEFQGEYYFVRPQADYIFDENGNMLVDRCYRLEDIKSNHHEVLALMKKEASLKHVNSTTKKGASVKDLTPAMRSIIAELYAVDFQKLTYDLH
jgi:hypothetical protein